MNARQRRTEKRKHKKEEFKKTIKENKESK